MSIRLLNTSSLDVARKVATDEDDQWDDQGNYIPPQDNIVVPIKCSIQPYKDGMFRVPLPEGIMANDARIIYTKTEILTANEYTGQVADEITINSMPYQCHYVEDWSQYGLRTDHYKCVFVKKDRNSV
jgi:hypothetical protein